MKTEFIAWIEKDGYTQHVLIPDDLFQKFREAQVKRIQVWFNSVGPFHLALNSKNGRGFLYISGATLKRIDAFPFEEIPVVIQPDETKYQAPEPKEWMELIEADEEIRNRFHALTIGKQRSILFAIDRMKSESARIRKTVSVANELRMGEQT